MEEWSRDSRDRSIRQTWAGAPVGTSSATALWASLDEQVEGNVRCSLSINSSIFPGSGMQMYRHVDEWAVALAIPLVLRRLAALISL